MPPLKKFVLTAEQQRLVEENYMLIPYTINRFFGWHKTQDADIMQIGALGLCDAAARYNESLGVKFGTYAINWIRYRVHNYFNRDKSLEKSNVSFDQLWEGGFDLTDPQCNLESEALNSVILQKLQISDRFKKKYVRDLTFEEISKQDAMSRQGIQKSVAAEAKRLRRNLRHIGITSRW